MTIKAIIFDFGRVIADFDHMIVCRKLANFSTWSAKEIYQGIFESGLEKDYDEGKINFESFYRQTVKKIRAKGKITIKTFKEIWIDIFKENPGIGMVLEKIKPEIRMLLLSNTNPVHWEYISQLPVIMKYFPKEENLILSFRLGFRKPDKRIFLEGIKKSGCQPTEIIYIEDVPEYLFIAKALGINGLYYDCQNEQPEILQKKLSKFGVLK